MVEAIHTVKGRGHLGSLITAKVVRKFREGTKGQDGIEDFDQLTGREKEILQLIAEGNSTKEIVDLLYISTNTVLTHRKNLKEKLDLHNFAQLTQYAISKGLIGAKPKNE